MDEVSLGEFVALLAAAGMPAACVTEGPDHFRVATLSSHIRMVYKRRRPGDLLGSETDPRDAETEAGETVRVARQKLADLAAALGYPERPATSPPA